MNLTQWKDNGELNTWLGERIKVGIVTLDVQDQHQLRTFADHMAQGFEAGEVRGWGDATCVTHIARAHFPDLKHECVLGFFNLQGVGSENGYMSGSAVRIVRNSGLLVMTGNHDLSGMELLSLLTFAAEAQYRHLQPVSADAKKLACDTLRKHEEGLASLLYRGHEQAEVLADHLALDAGRAVHDDKERKRRIHNARLVSTLLYALYGYNSEHGTTTEQDLLLHRIGFALDPVPLDPVVDARDRVAATRRTAVANLMRNSVEAHYTGCPADRGGVCNCTWLVDGDVLRTWLDETTVFTTR